MPKHSPFGTERRRETGAALLVTMLLLALVGMVGLASMDTVTRDRQVAGYQTRARSALYAAEAGVSTALGIIRLQTQALVDSGASGLLLFNPAFPEVSSPQALGSETNPPAFYGDPAATQPIRYLGAGPPCWAGTEAGVMSEEVGSVQWRDAVWDVRVVGTANHAGAVRIQSTATNCHPYN